MHIAYSPYFCKIYKFPRIFIRLTFFGLIYPFFTSPYFDHDAFTHHAIHVLDAPGDNDQLLKLSDTSSIARSQLEYILVNEHLKMYSFDKLVAHTNDLIRKNGKISYNDLD